MDMLKGDEIAAAQLTDWRKLAQGLHARYLVPDFGTGARFVAAVGEAGDALGHHPRVSIGHGYVDLELVTDDAIDRDHEGTEYVIEWVTQQDVDLARQIAPVWAVLLTGSAEARAAEPPVTRSETPRHGYRICGSGTSTSTRLCVSGSTSRCTSRPKWPINGSPPPSPQVGLSSMTATRRRSP